MVETRTRSGRQIKKPEFYTPDENVVLEDDYASDEYDSDFDSDIDTEDESDDDEDDYDDEDEDDEDDAGSLKDFVIDDEEEDA